MPNDKPNPFKDCRDTCDGKVNYIECYRDCLDRPTIDLVAKYFGEKSAEDCYGYSQMVVNAAYNFTKDHVDYAKKQGKSSNYPEYLRAGTITSLGPPRNSVEEYFLMPVAPYPPRKDKPPGGISNGSPDLESLKKFFKSNPCYQKQLIAQACEKNGGCSPEFIEAAKKNLSLSGTETQASSAFPKLLVAGVGVLLGFVFARRALG